MIAKRILGTIFLAGFLYSLYYKLSMNISDLEDNGFVWFLVLLTLALMIFAVRKVIRS